MGDQSGRDSMSPSTSWRSVTSRLTRADAPAWLTYSDGVLSGTPGNAEVGTYSVTLTATDLAGESVQHTFGITVDDVNDAPTVVNAMGDQSVDEGSDIVIDVSDVFGDIDLGDSLA
jgi:hypothetical protein